MPVQLTEAVVEFILFIVLLVLGIKLERKTLILPIYLIAYPVCRFILELFRGDEIRGIFWGLSTSQWISIMLVVYAIYEIIRKRKN